MLDPKMRETERNLPRLENCNLYDEIFAPQIFHHQSVNSQAKNVFKDLNGIGFLPLNRVQDAHRVCQNIAMEMKKQKEIALKQLEENLNQQISKFESNVLQVVENRMKLLESLDESKLEEKLEMFDVVTSESRTTPLTKLIMKCSDSLIVIFSYLTTKDIMKGISPSSSYFYHFVKKNVPIRVKIPVHKFDIYPFDDLLRGYRIYRIDFGVNAPQRRRVFPSIQNPMRIFNFVKNNASHLKRLEFHSLQELMILNEDLRPNKPNDKRFDGRMKWMQMNGLELRKIFDSVTFSTHLEYFHTTILPNNLQPNHFLHLQRLIFPIRFGDFFLPSIPGNKLTIDLLDTKRDIKCLTNFFKHGVRRSLKIICFVHCSYFDYLSEKSPGRHPQDLSSLILIKDLHDSIAHSCPSLVKFQTRIFESLPTMSNEFIEYLSQIRTVRLFFSAMGDPGNNNNWYGGWNDHVLDRDQKHKQRKWTEITQIEQKIGKGGDSFIGPNILVSVRRKSKKPKETKKHKKQKKDDNDNVKEEEEEEEEEEFFNSGVIDGNDDLWAYNNNGWGHGRNNNNDWDWGDNQNEPTNMGEEKKKQEEEKKKKVSTKT